MARDTKLTEKDMSVLREGGSTRETHDAKGASIRDYGLQHRVTIAWDLNDDAERDHIFRMTIGGKTALIDAEELMRYMRWV